MRGFREPLRTYVGAVRFDCPVPNGTCLPGYPYTDQRGALTCARIDS
jgi:hypothetical protein